MLKISKLADYAVVILAALISSDEDMLPVTTLAARSHVPEPTVSKIMKHLAKSGIIQSTRGARGGYSLTRTPDSITIADIITAIDGPISLTSCADGSTDSCCLSAECTVNGRWTNVNNAVKNALQSVSLTEMAQNNVAVIEGPSYVANR